MSRELVCAVVGAFATRGRLEDVRELAIEHDVLEKLGLKRLPSPVVLGVWLRREGIGTVVRAVQQLDKEMIRA